MTFSDLKERAAALDYPMTKGLVPMLSRFAAKNTRGDKKPEKILLPPAMFQELKQLQFCVAMVTPAMVAAWEKGGTLFRGIEHFPEEGLTEPKAVFE